MPATYKIPQNVDLEDKILGPLTLKQFLYTLAAGMVTFVSFQVFFAIASPVFYLITGLTWIFTAALVFVRPNDQPFSKFLTSFILFSSRPNRRIWKRIPSLGAIGPIDQKPKQAEGPAKPTPEEVKSRLSQLAHVIDTRGWSDVEALGDRVVSADTAAPTVNLNQKEEPEDILAAEDEQRGSARATAELERLLHGRATVTTSPNVHLEPTRK